MVVKMLNIFSCSVSGDSVKKVIDGKRNGATDVLMRSILKHAVPEWAVAQVC